MQERSHCPMQPGWACSLALALQTHLYNSRMQHTEERTMWEFVFVGVTIVFFAIAWAYTLGCDRL
jgi:hypothetical protein